jgi:3-carboxy-cis,cis-muconate cycloisomerase
VLAAAIRVPGLVSVMLTAMVQEHERGLGDWHAEWETLPEICCLAAGALAQLVQVLDGIELDPARMAGNLEATRGLVLAEAVTMALGAKIGRLPAHHLVEDACRRAVSGQRHLRDVLGEDAEVSKHLSPQDLQRLLDPANYVGLAEALVDRALAARGK